MLHPAYRLINRVHRLLQSILLPAKQVGCVVYLFVAFNSIALISYAQQGNTWYFGHNAGLTFNTNPPSALTDGQIFTYEGCSTISDDNGRLLFYTDGVTVWNKLHQVMVNGNDLKGQLSSSNAAIVIPKPGAPNIYYIFTSGSVETGNEGYFYSEIDMTRQGGLGEVTATKNILLYGLSTEKLTAARHSNGIDVWIITKEQANTTWKVFKVDCNGVDPTPVISTAGAVPGIPLYPFSGIGTLKASPDGTKLASVNTVENTWELFKFDASTGSISDALLFSTSVNAFGVEFSADSKLTYIADEDFFAARYGINQYNISTYNAAAIEASRVLVATGGGTNGFGSLQLGPDNKIYCAIEFSSTLGVINSPNTPGLGCNYVGAQVNLQGKQVFRGLPVLMPALVTNKNVGFSYTIGSDCATLDFNGTSDINGNLTWQWDFGDGTTGTGQHVSHTYAAGHIGTDTVKLIVTSNLCGGRAVAIKKPSPVVTQPPVAKFRYTIPCNSLAINFTDASVAGQDPLQNWLWDFGDGNTSTQQNPVHVYAAPGRYTVTLTAGKTNACNAFSVFRDGILVEPLPVIDFTNTTATCINQAIAFRDNSTVDPFKVAQWHWDFGDGHNATLQHASNTFAAPNTYNVKMWVQFVNGCNSDTASKNITIDPLPVAAFTNTAACIDQPIQFTSQAAPAIDSYAWDFGEGGASSVADPVYTYHRYDDFTVTLKAFTNNGCMATTSKVFHITPVHAFAGNDTTVASGQPLQLRATGGKDYLWMPPDFLNKNDVANPVAILDKDQRYRVQVTTEAGCVAFDDIAIHVLKGPDIYVPNAFAPTGKNNIFRPIPAGIQELYYFSVYNRYGQLLFTTHEQGKGWDGTVNGSLLPAGTFVWMLKAKDYRGRIITKSGTVLLLR